MISKPKPTAAERSSHGSRATSTTMIRLGDLPTGHHAQVVTGTAESILNAARASPLSMCIVRLDARPDAADDAGLGDDRLEDHLGEFRFTQGRLPEVR